MKQLDTALLIDTVILYMFGGPFFLGLIEALETNNAALKAQLIPIGLAITFFCALVIIIGVWLDGFCN